MAPARARTISDGSAGAVMGLARLGRSAPWRSVRQARPRIVRLPAPSWADAPEPLDVLVPRARRADIAGPWRFIRETAGVRARSVGDPPRLPVESTVLDLADTRDAGEVVGLVTTAVQRRLTTVKRLRQELGRRARHRHRALLGDLLADVGAGADSPIELRYLRDVERPHGLPRENDSSLGQVSRIEQTSTTTSTASSWSSTVVLVMRVLASSVT